MWQSKILEGKIEGPITNVEISFFLLGKNISYDDLNCEMETNVSLKCKGCTCDIVMTKKTEWHALDVIPKMFGD
jgi:hypothetical protein